MQMAITPISGVLWSPPCLFIVVTCLSIHSVFVMMFLVLCRWVLAHTLFYLCGGAGHLNLFSEIKTLWYYWAFWNYYYYFLLVLAKTIVCSIIIIIIMAQPCAAKFVQIISNTSASSSKLNCHCPSITAFWRSGLQSLNCLCSMWKAHLLTLFL